MRPVLIESICIRDGKPQHLRYHAARMADARSRLWRLKDEISLETLLEVPVEFRKGRVKCRVTYSGIIEKIEWAHYTPRTIRSLQLVDGDGLDYAFKYADRSGIDALMMHRGSADDILILKNGLLTDTSYSNIVLFDGNQYFTPAKPLLTGTCRARLIEAGRIKPGDIRPDDLKYFQEILLINSMLNLGDCAIRLASPGQSLLPI